MRLPEPNLQLGFALSMPQIRQRVLLNALNATVRELNIVELDRELASLVPPPCLAKLAGHGLRAEVLFPVPLLFVANPRLLGYYRLLLGYSQKEFYTSRTGLARFKSMEERGTLTGKNKGEVPALCQAVCSAASLLLMGLGGLDIDARVLDELTLLTLGPQLRGGANVKRGTAGIRVVFDAIHAIVERATTSITANQIHVVSAAGKKVLISFASDPDIIIQMEMDTEYRKLVAIEVKAGEDFSNIHNRLGEAEKSHQKARRKGYVECWTVVNVERFDLAMAAQESPSTNRFYKLADLLDESSAEHADFKARILSLTGI